MLYSTQGRINDTRIINHYASTDTVYFNNNAANLSSQSGFMDSIEFTDQFHAKMFPGFRWKNYDLSNQITKFILTGKDTTEGFIDTDPLSESLQYLIGQYRPEIYSEWLISSTRGYYYFGYTSGEKSVLKLSGNQLCAPLILYGKHKPYFGVNYVNNFLDEKFYLNIAEGDTVSVGFYSIKYER